jgi:capsid protein
MGPARPTIDPVKDAIADQMYLEMGVTSLTRVAAERFGVDYRTVRNRRTLDGTDARVAAALTPTAEAAIRLNAQTNPDNDKEKPDAG